MFTGAIGYKQETTALRTLLVLEVAFTFSVALDVHCINSFNEDNFKLQVLHLIRSFAVESNQEDLSLTSINREICFGMQ